MRAYKIISIGISGLIVLVTAIIAYGLMFWFLFSVGDESTTRDLVSRGIGSLIFFQMFKIQLSNFHKELRDE